MWALQGGGDGGRTFKLQQVALLQWDDGPWLPRHRHRQTGSTEVQTADMASWEDFGSARVSIVQFTNVQNLQFKHKMYKYSLFHINIHDEVIVSLTC